MNRGLLLLLVPALAASLMTDASAGSSFEPGMRVRFGPSLPKDEPAPSGPSPSGPPPSASAPSAPATSAAEQATAVARSVVRKVDPSMKGLLRRQEMQPPGTRNPGGVASPSQAQPSPTNRQEKRVGAGVNSAGGSDPSREVQQLQRGLLNDQKSNVGVTQ